MTTLELYLRHTRRAVYSCLFVMPLFLFYEVLALTLQAFQITSLRNGADIMIRNVAALIGLDNFPLVMILILVALGVTAGVHQKKEATRIHAAWFVLMFLESCVYALILGSVALTATSFFLTIPAVLSLSATMFQSDFWVNLMLSLGAGLHEEFLFRLIIIESCLLLGRELYFKDSATSPARGNALIALFISALLFSAFHYVGPFGDPFELDSFVFRAVSGVYLAFIYLARGFGIVAWTHALYDVFLLTGLL